MKRSIRFAFVLLALVLLFPSMAQEESLDKAYKKDAIEALSQLMNDFYVFPDVALLTSKHLSKQLKKGYFDAFKDKESFAQALTEQVQLINNDKHMRVRVRRPFVARENTPERMIEERLDRRNRSRAANYGYSEVKVMEGNVGYLDLRGFAGLENAKATADAAMKVLSRTDAIIFDLRKNGGGSPRMVQYLCSYFFDKKVHLNSLYWREGDETEEFWTLDEVGGTRLPDVPLFIMTSNYTFSGAEEFSYNMQTQKRATLVGQTTGGGANPGGSRRINDDLFVFIPEGRAINPITKTNWEGVGVVPEISTSEDETMEKTLALATEAAEGYREKTKETYSKYLNSLYRTLDQYKAGDSEEMILEALNSCRDNDILGEGDINRLGYQYLMENENGPAAEAIFKANTMLYPSSANVYDSYGEALMMNGNLKASVESYEKAVAAAKENGDGNLPFYQENLERVKKQLLDD